MIRAIIFACLTALPANAQQMTADTCQLGWQAFNLMTNQAKKMLDVQPDVTDQGWCRVDQTNAELSVKDFTSLEFRGTGVVEAVANDGAPESLDVRIEGIDLIHGWGLPLDEKYAGPHGSANLSFQRDPGTRDITLSALDAEFGGLGHLKITASGSGIDLTSLNAMQITSGGGRLHALTLQLQTTPVLKSSMLPSAAAAMGDIFVQAIPGSSIAPSSRDALSQFLATGSDTGGLLRIEASSEAGVGFLQMVGGVMPLEEKGLSEDVLTSSMEVLFSNVTLTADWTGSD